MRHTLPSSFRHSNPSPSLRSGVRKGRLAAIAWLCLGFTSALPARTPLVESAGKLVIAGGAVTSSTKEVWDVMLAERLAERPIGIISTASEDPQTVGPPLAEKLNQERGHGSAVFIPLGGTSSKAEDPDIVALIRGCGGFFFTGGQQQRTTRALLRPDGGRTAALEAIWEIYQKGGVIGGSSAGAAIMSDPMITGGTSANALRHGATPASAPKAGRGVGHGPGLGFHPEVLYCQHHLERGRFGRLLAALASESLDFQTGVGVAEDTAWVVDHAQQTGAVIGAKGVLHVDVSKAVKRADGGISGVRLHYLDRGDSLHLQDGSITPAAGKTEMFSEGGNSAPIEAPEAWRRDVIWHLLTDLAKSGAPSAVAHDERFNVTFRRTPQTRVWRKMTEAGGERPTWTISDIAVEVTPK